MPDHLKLPSIDGLGEFGIAIALDLAAIWRLHSLNDHLLRNPPLIKAIQRMIGENDVSNLSLHCPNPTLTKARNRML
jgi:hypothetical protein